MPSRSVILGVEVRDGVLRENVRTVHGLQTIKTA